MWGSNPRPKNPWSCRRRHLLRYSSGVLVRLTTCKRLTNSLPKLSLVTVMAPSRTEVGRGETGGGVIFLTKRYLRGFFRNQLMSYSVGSRLPLVEQTEALFCMHFLRKDYGRIPVVPPFNDDTSRQFQAWCASRTHSTLPSTA